MENNLEEYEQETGRRPTLLTVLCILTFIGSGWAIVTNIWAYSTAAKTAEIFENNIPKGIDSSDNRDSVVAGAVHKKRDFFGGKMMVSVSKMMTVENIRKTALGVIISDLFTLAGALLMWWLRKRGFYIYIIGVIISFVVPFYLYGGNLMAVGMSTFSGFFGLVFIALYSLNLKSMR